MPTQTGSLDLSAQKKAHDDAAKVATNYVSKDNTGLMVSDGDGTQTPSTATERNVFIDNDSVDIRNGQDVLASFGTDSYVGDRTNSKPYIGINETGVYAYGESNVLAARIGEISRFGTPTENGFYISGSNILALNADNYSVMEASFGGSGGVFAEALVAINNTTNLTLTYTLTRTVEANSYIFLSFRIRGVSSRAGSFDKTYIDERFQWVDATHELPLKGSETIEVIIDTANNCVIVALFSTVTAYNNYPCVVQYRTSDTISRYFRFGRETVSSTDDQFVVGRGNSIDTSGVYAFIVGCAGVDPLGNLGPRRNAFSVDWNGNVKARGEVNAGGSTPLVPIGTILDFAGSTLPTGYLECDGSAVSRTDYAALFAALGTTWGAGDGSTTFNLPDFRGRTTIGSGTGTASDATAHALGSTGGAETHTLTGAESGTSAHGHGMTQPKFNVGAHQHTILNSAIMYNANGSQRLATSGSGTKASTNTDLQYKTLNSDVFAATQTQNAAVSTATAADATSAHNNLQPFAVVTKIIRAL